MEGKKNDVPFKMHFILLIVTSKRRQIFEPASLKWKWPNEIENEQTNVLQAKTKNGSSKKDCRVSGVFNYISAYCTLQNCRDKVYVFVQIKLIVRLVLAFEP